MEKCKEIVWDGFHNHHCSRNAGHGPGEAYCKQHAKKYIHKMDLPTLKIIYKVHVDYHGNPTLVEAEVISETNKKYIVKTEYDGFFGYKQTVNKDGYVFNTKKEALEAYLLNAKSNLNYAESKLRQAKRNLDWVEAQLEGKK